MDGILWWVVTGVSALFFVAVVVAWWEHLGHSAPPHRSFATPQPRAVTVDVDLDQPDPAHADDGAERRAAFDGALGRMTRPGGLPETRRNWLDTKPMIGPGERVAQRRVEPTPHA